MVVFDKTGTLTKGVFEISDVLPLGALSKDTMLALGAASEQYSKHPIATALLMKAQSLELAKAEVTSGKTIAGKGVAISLAGTTYYIGNKELMLEILSYNPESLKSLEDAFEKAKELKRVDCQVIRRLIVYNIRVASNSHQRLF